MSEKNPPKQSVLEKLHKKSISAKDIATQFWCEKQMELSYLYGFPTTKAMDRGSSIHQQMQVEIYKELVVPPVTYPDKMYKTAYENVLSINTLMDKSVARELKVYGSINGYNVVGQIDELRIKDGKVVIVENKTTGDVAKMSPEYTKPHYVQIMLYRKMLEDLKHRSYRFENLDVSYKLSQMALSEKFVAGLKDIGVKDELLSVKGMYLRMFDAIASIPELSNVLVLHYVNRNTKQAVAEINVDYDKDSINKDLIYALKYWNGERDASPVPESEKWKCKVCRFFGDKCLVWYNK